MIGEIEPDYFEEHGQFQSDHYCEHGTYIGSWAGPDYLCPWCEDGTSWAEYLQERWWNAWERYAKPLQQWQRTLAVITDPQWNLPRSSVYAWIANVFFRGHDAETMLLHVEQLRRLAAQAPDGVTVPFWFFEEIGSGRD